MIGRRFAALALCALAAAVAASPAGAAAGDWTSYTWANGVRDIAVGGNTLWWATSGGAVRVDLTSLEVDVLHRSRGTLVSDTLTSVCVGPDGTVWFGSSDRAVSGYAPSTSSWLRIQGIDGLEDPRVNTLTCAGTSLWVGTKRGFVEFRDGLARNACFQGIDLGCGLVSFDTRAILLSGSTRWIGTLLGVSRFAEGEWDTLNAGLAATAVVSLAALEEEIWCVAGSATPDGTVNAGVPYRFDGAAWVRMDEGLAQIAVRRLAVLDGVLYAASAQGLYVWNGSWTRLGSSLDATCAAIDGQGRIWVGLTASGVARWEDGGWRQLLAPGPRTERKIRALRLTAEGGLWFTHEFPVLGSYAGGVWTQYDNGNTGGALENQWTAGIELTGEGDLWVGHCCCRGDTDCRVDRRDAAGGWTMFPSMVDVMSIAEDPSGDLWFGTVAHSTEDEPNGAYFLARGAASEEQLLIADTGGCLPSDQVRAILAPADGRVIFGSLGDGVAIWDYGPSVTDLSDDACSRFRQSTGDLRSDDVTALLLRGGELWVGTTAGISVIALSSGAARFISTSQGLAGDQVTGLASDPLGRVWATTRSGVSAITPQAGGQQIESFAYPDLVNDRVNAVGVDARRGLVWFGTDHGFSSYQAWDPDDTAGGEIEASVFPNPYYPGVQQGRDCGGLCLLTENAGPFHGEIYDLSGREVATYSGVADRELIWTGTDSHGDPVPSGLYVIVLRTASGRVGRAHVAVLR